MAGFVITAVLTLAAVAVLIPAAVLLAEIVAAAVPDRTDTDAGRDLIPPRLAVLVPAHDEAPGIGATLSAILLQLQSHDRLVVVADNCGDTTADVSTAHGAEVAVRSDPSRRGKSYALDFGVRHLAGDPPDVVIVVDADCIPDAGALAAIGALSHATGRPVQADYALTVPAEAAASRRLQMAAFAFRVKNRLRALGRHRLGLPCQLMGTGMAFPWSLLSRADLGSGELAEDLVLGLDLARANHAPLYCPSARVASAFPISSEGQTTQRARWEAGHLTTIAKRLPALLLEAARKRNSQLLALSLDAAVPPLALHCLAIVAVLAAALAWALTTGRTTALVPSLLSALFLACAVGLAWWKTGRDNMTLIELAMAPAYALSKIPLYAQILRGRRISWIRSKRD
jgi:cellulose synthase/poly-beta-1,6-N-acetylglucosamine synthase-like glycosyltransferase